MTSFRLHGGNRLLITLGVWLLATASIFAADFGGLWQTTWGGSTTATKLLITLSGANATGKYAYKGGVITGTVSGNVLTGTWKQADDGDTGTFEFTLSADGESFKGKYRQGTTGAWNTDGWNGSRDHKY